jgi:hypothetical protein
MDSAMDLASDPAKSHSTNCQTGPPTRLLTIQPSSLCLPLKKTNKESLNEICSGIDKLARIERQAQCHRESEIESSMALPINRHDSPYRCSNLFFNDSTFIVACLSIVSHSGSHSGYRSEYRSESRKESHSESRSEYRSGFRSESRSGTRSGSLRGNPNRSSNTCLNDSTFIVVSCLAFDGGRDRDAQGTQQ